MDVAVGSPPRQGFASLRILECPDIERMERWNGVEAPLPLAEARHPDKADLQSESMNGEMLNLKRRVVLIAVG